MFKKPEAEQKAMIAAGDFWAVDLGGAGAIAVHGKNGPAEVSLLSRKGLNPADRNAGKFRILLHGEDGLLVEGLPALPLVTEASTPGTCGIDENILWGIVSSSEFDIWKMSTRHVKNHRKDTVETDAEGKLPAASDAECARIIYEQAEENQDRLSIWRGPETKVPVTIWVNKSSVVPKYRSVRPYDKRGYKDPFVDKLISQLPPFGSLCPDLQIMLGERGESGKWKGYGRSRAFPLAQSLDDPYAEDRNSWEKLIGLNGNGRKCHYRRNTEEIRQRVANVLAGVKKNAEVSPQQRKESWKITRKLLREFYHLAQGTYHPAKGTDDPAPTGSRVLADLEAERARKGIDTIFDEEDA